VGKVFGEFGGHMQGGGPLAEFLARAADVLFPADPPRAVTVDSRASDGDTPLHIAALWGDVDAARRLVEAGADVNAPGDMTCPPLFFAVMAGHAGVAELLLRLGADPDVPTELGYTPRTLAEHKGDPAVIAVFKGAAELSGQAKPGPPTGDQVS
jgi:uncharacterized protein